MGSLWFATAFAVTMIRKSQTVTITTDSEFDNTGMIVSSILTSYTLRLGPPLHTNCNTVN